MFIDNIFDNFHVIHITTHPSNPSYDGLNQMEMPDAPH